MNNKGGDSVIDIPCHFIVMLINDYSVCMTVWNVGLLLSYFHMATYSYS